MILNLKLEKEKNLKQKRKLKKTASESGGPF